MTHMTKQELKELEKLMIKFYGYAYRSLTQEQKKHMFCVAKLIDESIRYFQQEKKDNDTNATSNEAD